MEYMMRWLVMNCMEFQQRWLRSMCDLNKDEDQKNIFVF